MGNYGVCCYEFSLRYSDTATIEAGQSSKGLLGLLKKSRKKILQIISSSHTEMEIFCYFKIV